MCFLVWPLAAADNAQLLLRSPSVSKSRIVFEYANDLWIVNRHGGEAKRLTSGIGREFDPHFSPAGPQIAFSGKYDGNVDIYAILTTGGIPRRLTYHPGRPDVAIGWAPDGKHIFFNSRCGAYADSGQLYAIPVDSTFPEALPLPTAEDGSFSADGSHIAYVPVFQWQAAWKRYRGGQTTKIWLANLADSTIVKILRENSNDFNPMWVGDRVYFLSDRSGSVGLWAYDTGSGKVSEIVQNNRLDFKSASEGAGAIVYEQFGAIHLYDLKSGKARRVELQISADLPEVRPHFEKLSVAKIEKAAISPTVQRALFEAHGEILTVPAEKGDIRNLTSSPSVAGRDPAWSPDNRWLAYCKQLENHLHAIFVYSLADGKSHQITDGLSDATSPDFDKSGKYLFFVASTTPALSGGRIDMSSIGHLLTSAAYVAVPRKDVASPLAPQSDDENAAPAKKDESKGKSKDAKDALPDTTLVRFTSFNRYFFAQIGREGAVIEERYNHGGDVADYIIDYLNRKSMGRIMTREGEDITDPTQAIYGPKVMIINQFAGSGGDAMPWYFRKTQLGPLVGMKTWGGLIGIGNYPPLIDGGRVTAPRWAFYGVTGQWEVENHGIAPDVEVDLEPQAARAEHDPQLEGAVEVALDSLKKNPPPTFDRPVYPNYHQRFSTEPSQ